MFSSVVDVYITCVKAGGVILFVSTSVALHSLQPTQLNYNTTKAYALFKPNKILVMSLD